MRARDVMASPGAEQTEVSRWQRQSHSVQMAGNSTGRDGGQLPKGETLANIYPTDRTAQTVTLRYPAVLEDAGNNWSAYAPDVAGCCATGPTRAAAAESLASALKFHFEGMIEDKIPIPAPSQGISELPDTKCETAIIEVSVPKPWCMFSC